MKKRLSLLVAVLMMLTLVPASAFAVEAKYSSVVYVDDSEGEATFSAVFTIEESDIKGLKDGAVAVRLVGDNVEFKENAVEIDPITTGTSISISDTYATGNINATTLRAGNKIHINGTVKFNYAVDGEYKIIYDLSGIGLPLYPERVFAKLTDKDTGFTKVTGAVKKIARGKEQDVAPFEVTGKPGEIVRVKLPSTDFKFYNVNEEGHLVAGNKSTSITNGELIEVDNNKGTLTFKMSSTKAFVRVFLTATKDAPKGEVEFDVMKGEFRNKEFRAKATDTILVAEYVDYAVVMELVKALQEKFANGETYKVDVKVKTSNRDPLPRLIDFESENAGVKVLSGGGRFEKVSSEEFTWFNERDGQKAEMNEFNMRLEVSPDWDSKGDVLLKAKGRGMEELSLVILKVKPVAEMKVDMKEILGGDSKVAVSDIVITETEAGAMKTGEWFGVSLTGLKFAEDVKFDSKGEVVTEGISVRDGDYKLDKDGRTIYFKINARSKKDAPGKITLKNVEVVSNRSFPFGTHKLDFVHVGPFEKNGKTIKAIVGFKKITTPQGNTIEEAVYDDVEIENVNLISKGGKYAFRGNEHAELHLINRAEFIKVVDKVSKVKKTTIFTLGSADYTVDGVAMKLDTPVFTQDNYTMLPVRAIADALGVDVVWNQENLTATFIDGDIVVSVTQDAKMLYKNGNSYPMVTKATVKADRMFIPVSSVGDAFGLTRDYDYLYNKTSKEVTIYPKAMPAAAEEVKAEEVKAEEVK